MQRMCRVVKVTRRGQTTIPLEFRKRYNIDEGSRLVFEAREDDMVVRPLASLEDLGGFLARDTNLKRVLEIIEESREEEEE